MEKNARTLGSFEKNGCPTLRLIRSRLFYVYLIRDTSSQLWPFLLLLYFFVWISLSFPRFYGIHKMTLHAFHQSVLCQRYRIWIRYYYYLSRKEPPSFFKKSGLVQYSANDIFTVKLSWAVSSILHSLSIDLDTRNVGNAYLRILYLYVHIYSYVYNLIAYSGLG